MTHKINTNSQNTNQEQKPAQAASKAGVVGDRNGAFKKVWAATHWDFRGTWNGVLSLMSYAKFGGGLVTADTITDAELAERLQEVRS